MKKLIVIAVTLLYALFVSCTPAAALSGEDITAQAAVLIDADTGQVLYEKNISQPMYPASITKLMTGLLVMENCSATEIITVSGSAVEIPYNTSHIALSPGEQFPVSDAMYAMMMPSANDAANALAEHVAGSQEAFVELMNQRARELGAMDTHFTNAHGLPDENHYTTAYDMALIMMAAIKNEALLPYIGTARYTMPPTNIQEEERPFTNQQFMLLPDMWVYNPDIIGGKVGYTSDARHTMSTAASRDGRTLVAVVMSCGIDEKFYDTQALLDYGFDEFVSYTVPQSALSDSTVIIKDAGTELGYATFRIGEDLRILLHRSINPDTIRYIYDYPDVFSPDDPVTGNLVLKAPDADNLPKLLMIVPLSPQVTMLDLDGEPQTQTEEPQDKRGVTSIVLRVLGVLLAVGAGLALLLIVIRLCVRSTARRRRRLRREAQLRRTRRENQRPRD